MPLGVRVNVPLTVRLTLLVRVCDLVRVLDTEGVAVGDDDGDTVLELEPLSVGVPVSVPLPDVVSVEDAPFDSEGVAVALLLGVNDGVRLLDGVPEVVRLLDGVPDPVAVKDRVRETVGETEGVWLPEGVTVDVDDTEEPDDVVPVPVPEKDVVTEPEVVPLRV